MRIIHLLAVIFTGLLISQMSYRFKCGVPSCWRSFDSSGALLRHRSSCVHYRQESTIRPSLYRKRPLLRTDTTSNLVAKKAKLDQPEVSVNVGELIILDTLCISPQLC
ncbi:hypothetical protein L210DRAFT_2342559 [Boletus edulis BED1]|uniref:C2H2-type domain-containing protein n=1 Tax=Boletus edulis BED1 TaxID=1328754 RepID=A0AAD4BRD5_BOLED|nr:hypothetical protein L210DRAFT_2342559 [Boletus edulis BED1]